MGSCCITPPVLLNLAAKKIFDLVFMPVSRPASVQLKSFTLLPNGRSRLLFTLSRVCPRFVLLLVDICWVSGW